MNHVVIDSSTKDYLWNKNNSKRVVCSMERTKLNAIAIIVALAAFMAFLAIHILAPVALDKEVWWALPSALVTGLAYAIMLQSWGSRRSL